MGWNELNEHVQLLNMTVYISLSTLDLPEICVTRYKGDNSHLRKSQSDSKRFRALDP